MMKYSRSTNRYVATPMIGSRQTLRIPRGLAMLRALRLRLAAEKQPRLQQEEFYFIGNR